MKCICSAIIVNIFFTKQEVWDTDLCFIYSMMLFLLKKLSLSYSDIILLRLKGKV